MPLPGTIMTHYHHSRRLQNRRVEFASHFQVVVFSFTGKRV
jgi:hypothetical protein